MGSPQNSGAVNATFDEDDSGDFSKPFKLVATMLQKWFFTRSEEGTGRWEAAGMVLVCLSRAAEFKLQTQVVRWMDGTLTSRNLGDFRTGLVRLALLNTGGAGLRIIYSYLQARLTWKWRRKLTDHVQDAYFQNKAYYFIGEGGGVKGSKMLDADHRIVEDLKVTAQAFSDCFSDAIFTTTEGVFYTFSLYSISGWKMAVAPYFFVVSTFLLVNKLSPARKRWRRLGNQRMASYGAFRGGQQRLTLQSEAVAALRGETFENRLIMEQFTEFRARTSALFWEYYKFGAVNSFIASRIGSLVFVPAMTIAPGAWQPKFERMDSIEKMQEVRSDVGVQWLLLTRTMEASRKVVEIIRKLEELVGQVSRVTDLMALLESVEMAKTDEYTKNFEDGDVIEFKHVTIVTPATPPVKLVENLSFRLEKGSSILLTGHNGAGKSSIFRCMGGLWNIPQGTITKPGGASSSGLHHSIFYLPQKPYNVLGTLADQMTYPDKHAGGLSREALFAALEQVDLTYLLDREGVMDSEINWEDACSLGEKQRLAIARLIWHKPQFAILDECTSAVSREMEQRLYDICAKHNITYVTISHRPALLAYHDTLLAIGDGKCGFKISTIERSVHATAVGKLTAASVVDKDTESSIKAHLTARSTKYDSLQQKRELPQRSNKARFARLWQLGRPDNLGKQLFGMCVFFACQIWLMEFKNYNEGRMYGALMNQDRRLMLRLLGNAGATAFAIAWTVETFLYIQKEVAATMSERITRRLQQRYIHNKMYYRLHYLDGRIKDADQRLAEDVRQFGDAFTDLAIWMWRPFNICVWDVFRLASFFSWRVPVAMFGYFTMAAIVLKAVAPDYKELWRELSRLEGRFAFVHARTKSCAESIAFFGGDEREKAIVGQRFEELMAHDWIRNWVNFKFRIVEDVFQARMPDLIQWGVRFSYGRSFSDEQIITDRGGQMYQGQVQLASMTQSLFGHMGIILRMSGEPFATLTGKVARITELDEVMQEIEDELAGSTANMRVVNIAEPVVRFEDVDIVTPRGENLAEKMNLSVTPDTPLMVTGSSAAGKSSLVRVLGGLWPLHCGNLTRPAGADGRLDLNGIFLVPQKIHMATGTLADQVTYPVHIKPKNRTPEVESKLQELLDLVGVGYLVTRWAGDVVGKKRAEHKGWDHETKWDDVLSLGEQQRIGMSRLFYHQPKLGVLDECTSAVSIDVEERLYRTAAQAGIATITLSQRLALEEFHTHELRLGANNARGWERLEIPTTPNPATLETPGLPELHEPRVDAAAEELE